MIAMWIGIISVIVIYSMIMYKCYKETRLVNEIVEYVKGYSSRCTYANRFIVTVESLETVFPEYPSFIIVKAWNKLVLEGIIKQDIMDGEWCISNRG